MPVQQSFALHERKVAQILGPEVFEGISGGLDTLCEIIALSPGRSHYTIDYCPLLNRMINFCVIQQSSVSISLQIVLKYNYFIRFIILLHPSNIVVPEVLSCVSYRVCRYGVQRYMLVHARLMSELPLYYKN